MNGYNPLLGFTVSRTYDVVTEISAESGSTADNGHVYEDKSMTYEELLREIRDFGFLDFSISCNKPDDFDAHHWLISQHQQNMYSGDERTEYLHINGEDRDMTAREYYALYVLADLISF